MTEDACMLRNVGMQALTNYSPHSYPVQLADMDWQEEDTAQIALEMGGMSIKKGYKHFRQGTARPGPSFDPQSQSTNADSMFAWLSKLLPGL